MSFKDLALENILFLQNSELMYVIKRPSKFNEKFKIVLLIELITEVLSPFL